MAEMAMRSNNEDALKLNYKRNVVNVGIIEMREEKYVINHNDERKPWEIFHLFFTTRVISILYLYVFMCMFCKQDVSCWLAAVNSN